MQRLVVRSAVRAPLLVVLLSVGRGVAARLPKSSRRTAFLPASCGDAAYAEFRRSVAIDDGAGDAAAARRDRQDLFRRRCEAVLAQNAKAGATWRATLNRFSDRTDAELQVLLGYKRTDTGRHRHSGRRAPSFLAAVSRRAGAEDLPDAVDWRKGLQSAGYVRHQGDCGSCWAIASVGALEMHAELRNESATRVSSDHLVRCMPNPQRCGGTGGCDGATAELAFQHARLHGIAVERSPGEPPEPADACKLRAGRRAVVSDFVHLPRNRAEPLLHALATRGPVVVSVDASEWWPYHSGVYDSCATDAVVNHAVLAVGYDKEAYIIRNSWGSLWGEDGHIRLMRLGGSGNGHCGVDDKPQDGVACVGAPREVRVCGMCGVLFDAAYPVGVRFVGREAPPSAGQRRSPQPAAVSGPSL